MRKIHVMFDSHVNFDSQVFQVEQVAFLVLEDFQVLEDFPAQEAFPALEDFLVLVCRECRTLRPFFRTQNFSSLSRYGRKIILDMNVKDSKNNTVAPLSVC